MGWGDELIACGHAKTLHAATGQRIEILGRTWQRRQHEVWQGVPYIVQPGEQGEFHQMVNGPGIRPYIAAKNWDHWTWHPYHCVPGEIIFTVAEREFATRYRRHIIIEPTIKPRASPNKQWGAQRWQRFAKLAKAAGYGLTQLGPPGTRPIENATMICTPSFRQACAVLANASAYVGHEGGMHHAAAALGIPAVVIFGGFISPAQTGYADPLLRHRNLFAGGEPCGMRVPCKHCDIAMAAITPQMVLNELNGILNEQ